MDDETIKHLRTLADGAAPGIINFIVGRIVTSGEVKATKELANRYGKIAEEMKKSKGAGGGETEPVPSLAREYRIRLEASERPCGICVEMLKRLEDRTIEEQVEGVPTIAEATGAARSGAEVEQLKEIMGKNSVLRDILVEMGEGAKGK